MGHFSIVFKGKIEENEPVMEMRRILEKRENKNSGTGQFGVNTSFPWGQPTLLGIVNMPSRLRGERRLLFWQHGDYKPLEQF